MKPKLEALVAEGFRIVVFTNQGGVESGKTNVLELEKKFELIQKHMALPMVFLAATTDDIYRKPATGMWDFCRDTVFQEFTIDVKGSLYCGDAAGRPKTATRPKDFSDNDIKFAANIGVEFFTPEELFLGEKKQGVLKPLEKAVPKEEVKREDIDYTSKTQEMILLHGAPGCGKSTFWKHHLQSYTRINQDEQGSAAKC